MYQYMAGRYEAGKRSEVEMIYEMSFGKKLQYEIVDTKVPREWEVKSDAGDYSGRRDGKTVKGINSEQYKMHGKG